MDKIKLQTKQDEKIETDIAEKSELASNTNFVTKEEILQKQFAKDVVKTEMVIVAGQVFKQYEKDLDESNQVIKSFENYIVDDENKNDAFNKVFENNKKENVNSGKGESHLKIQ